MKTLKLLLAAVFLCGLITATVRSQPPAVIKVDLSFPAHSFTQMLIPIK